MGITGLIPFVSGASRKAHVSEWSGCSVAIDAYGWLHRGAFACADRLARGDSTDLHIKYCMKYVLMLISKNVKPVLVFDGRHLPAKAGTEAKRRESRKYAKIRAAELLRLGQIEDARTYMRRSIDITHEMALQLIQECRKRNVDCIVAPYEADAQLAYLNIKNIVQLVITEDSDLILFGCTKVLFKMDLDGNGILVDTARLPLVMKCPVERYSFDKFRQMCIMSGCDYLPSLPGIGLAKARQFITTTQDPDIANALKKLPSYFNKLQLVVSDEYRDSFLKAEATFKHQYVFDPLTRSMVRLLDPYDEGTDLEMCCNAGELLDPETAFQLALGNIDPFSLRKMDDWHPDAPDNTEQRVGTSGWKETGVCRHPSMWRSGFAEHTARDVPWRRPAREEPPALLAATGCTLRKRVDKLPSRVVPETQDENLTMESLKNMYCVEPTTKKQKFSWEEISPDSGIASAQSSSESRRSNAEIEVDPDESPPKTKSPIIENKNRSFKKALTKSSYSILKRLSKFPRTILDDKVVESKFFSVQTVETIKTEAVLTENEDSAAKEESSSQKENSPIKTDIENRISPILDRSVGSVSRNPFKMKMEKEFIPLEDIPLSEDSIVENTYPMEKLMTPISSQSFSESPVELCEFKSCSDSAWRGAGGAGRGAAGAGRPPRRGTCRAPGLAKRGSASLPSNQPTLLSKFGFQKKAVLK